MAPLDKVAPVSRLWPRLGKPGNAQGSSASISGMTRSPARPSRATTTTRASCAPADRAAAALSDSGYPWISADGHQPGPTSRTLRIGRWGNVLAVRLPQGLSALLQLQMGDDLEVKLLSSAQLLLTPAPRRSRLALCAALQRSGAER